MACRAPDLAESFRLADKAAASPELRPWSDPGPSARSAGWRLVSLGGAATPSFRHYDQWLNSLVSPASEETGTPARITLYWRPGCVFCRRLRFVLWWHRLSVRQVNIWQNPDAAAFVRSVAGGNETVPTVVIDGHPMVNPAPRQVIAAVRPG